MFGFLFAPPPQQAGGELLSGVVVPSRDSVGRRYPFVVFSTLLEAAFATGPHLAPLTLGEFLAGAAEVAYSAQDTPTSNVESLLASLRPASAATFPQHWQDYERWTQTTEAAAAFSVTFGDAYLDHAAHAVETILQCVEPWRGVEYPDTPLAVRLPIAADGVSTVAFWVDVVRRAAGWQRTVPSLFWHWDGDYGEMLVHFGVPPAGSLIELWSPDEDSDHICDLTALTTVPFNVAVQRLPPSIAHVLRSRDARVIDLLSALVG